MVGRMKQSEDLPEKGPEDKGQTVRKKIRQLYERLARLEKTIKNSKESSGPENPPEPGSGH
jgi:hypothetical protein